MLKGLPRLEKLKRGLKMKPDIEKLLQLVEKPDCTTDELIILADAVKPLIEKVRELERMADIMAEQLACVEIAPSICRGCKEQDMFGMYSCGGKDCIYFMVKQAAKDAVK